jgi:peptidase M28-like protein
MRGVHWFMLEVRLMSVSRQFIRAGLALLASVPSWGCAPASPAVSAGAGPSELASQAARQEPAPPPLPPLSSEEQQLRGELETEVAALVALGPRSLAHSWNLASATDHLARRLEVYGHQVQRQGFSVGDEVLQNLEIVLPGSTSEATLVIAAHYDSAAESPAANASASGAAALLCLAKQLVGQHPARGVRLVWLANESGGPGLAGSTVYAELARKNQLQVLGTLTLGSLGYYSLSSGSQRYPEELLYGDAHRSHYANFIALVSNAGSHELLDSVRPALAHASLPVEELILPDSAPLAADGPQARFWRAGLTGVALTDTAQFRSAPYDDAADTLDKLDFDRLARVTHLLQALVVTLAGPLAPAASP